MDQPRRLSQRLNDLDEKARAAYVEISTARLVMGLAALRVVVGVSVGLAFGNPIGFLLGMIAYGLFPLFVVATSKRRRARRPAESTDDNK